MTVQKISRREALRGTGVAALAAGAAVVPFAGARAASAPGVGEHAELTRLIEKHRRTDKAFDEAIDRYEEERSKLHEGEPTIESSLGTFAVSLYVGKDECLRMFARHYEDARLSINRVRKLVSEENLARLKTTMDAGWAHDEQAIDRAYADLEAAEAAADREWSREQPAHRGQQR